MRTTSGIHSLSAALCIAAIAAGCSGDGPTATEQEPDPKAETTTLIIDFAHIEVIDDCDGIEGDGDFDFVVSTSSPLYRTHYDANPTLPPGGRTATIGRQTFTYEASAEADVAVHFIASEWDRDIFQNEYHDERLDGEAAEVTHYLRNGTWVSLGDHAATLGEAGCQVRLTWTARVG